MQTVARSPVSAFISYSHKDVRYKVQLESHLSLLKRQGLIAGWSDQDITSGKNLDDEISARLESAQVFLPLVSSDFIDSEYCYGIELKRAIERHSNGTMRVIPIIVRPVVWKGAPFASLKMLPRDAKALTTWRNRDEAWKDVVEGIRAAIYDLQEVDVEHRLATQNSMITGVEMGWLDIAANIEESAQEFTRQMEQLSSIPTTLQESLRMPIVRLQASKNGTAAGQRHALSAVSKILVGFADDTEACLPGLRSSWQVFTNNARFFSDFASKYESALHLPENRISIETTARHLEDFREGIRKPIDDLLSTRASLQQLSGISRDLNFAVQRISEAFDGCIELLQLCESSVSDLLIIFQNLLGSG